MTNKKYECGDTVIFKPEELLDIEPDIKFIPQTALMTVDKVENGKIMSITITSLGKGVTNA